MTDPKLSQRTAACFSADTADPEAFVEAATLERDAEKRELLIIDAADRLVANENSSHFVDAISASFFLMPPETHPDPVEENQDDGNEPAPANIEVMKFAGRLPEARRTLLDLEVATRVLARAVRLDKILVDSVDRAGRRLLRLSINVRGADRKGARKTLTGYAQELGEAIRTAGTLTPERSAEERAEIEASDTASAAVFRRGYGTIDQLIADGARSVQTVKEYYDMKRVGLTKLTLKRYLELQTAKALGRTQ